MVGLKAKLRSVCSQQHRTRFGVLSLVTDPALAESPAVLDSRASVSYPPRVDVSDKLPTEWFLQADYDMDTAQYMFEGGRYFYCIFMCHLSIEKALKGLYRARLNSDPPKVHNLLYLAQKVQLTLPPALQEVVFMLNRVSVPTRYPEELRSMSGLYDHRKTEAILTESKRVVTWLKTQLPE